MQDRISCESLVGSGALVEIRSFPSAAGFILSVQSNQVVQSKMQFVQSKHKVEDIIMKRWK